MNSLLKAINGVVLSRQSEYIDICIHGDVYKNARTKPYASSLPSSSSSSQ